MEINEVLTGEKVLSQIESVSKKDRVVQVLREAIVTGNMKPGNAIVENKVAQQLGVGQPLVREALIELEHQGFVRRFPYRGTYVTKLSPEDIKQIFELRIKLEGIAIDWARQKAGHDEIEALRHNIGLMKLAARNHDAAQFYENDLEFHRKLWKLSGNKYLVEALERVVVPLFAFFVIKTTSDRESLQESAERHEKILDAFDLPTPDYLRRFMEETLRGWKDDMLSNLLPDESMIRE
jgi:DNA-binding GntR family transcriptional regulator